MFVFVIRNTVAAVLSRPSCVVFVCVCTGNQTFILCVCVCVVYCCVYNSLHPIVLSPFVLWKVLFRISCLVVVVLVLVLAIMMILLCVIASDCGFATNKAWPSLAVLQRNKPLYVVCVVDCCVYSCSCCWSGFIIITPPPPTSDAPTSSPSSSSSSSSSSLSCFLFF